MSVCGERERGEGRWSEMVSEREMVRAGDREKEMVSETGERKRERNVETERGGRKEMVRGIEMSGFLLIALFSLYSHSSRREADVWSTSGRLEQLTSCQCHGGLFDLLSPDRLSADPMTGTPHGTIGAREEKEDEGRVEGDVESFNSVIIIRPSPWPPRFPQ